MKNTPSFSIYNASAGSGKTYTLVKEYLKILFLSKSAEPYKRILAITFTNKAVAEMKERIITTLQSFSEDSILEKSDSMFISIAQEINMDPKLLIKKSKSLLNSILYNYAAFDISTIDGFTHRIIRTFAYDLKLPLNFEIELDQETLLNEAVDSLIAKAGTNKALTQILVDFAIEKVDEDKSWDLAFDFNKIAKLLVNENDIPYIEQLKDKNFEDFKTLKSQLRKDLKQAEDLIIEDALGILTLIENAGIAFNDFSRGSLPKHFNNLSIRKFNITFDSNWQTDLLEGHTLYPKRVSQAIASTIEEIQPQLIQAFIKTKQAVYYVKFLKAFYKNITPLSVINAINNELTLLKSEQNKMLISEFNSIISKEIKNQPTPFIYERIGEKFKHFFIDEFQDTSLVQWENLIPLLENALSTEGGSAMLVGDAKQAIYRWRGGKAEQFIGLFNNENPFHIEKTVSHLPSNFRSFKEVVSFNNGFFKFLSHQVFNHNNYQTLYEEAPQKITNTQEGYVELNFLDFIKDDDRDVLFPEQTLKTIKTCVENGYSLDDICVIVRKKKEGIAIANYLSQNNITIISSETLLINNSPDVVFVNNVLALLIQPKNNEIKIAVLSYLSDLFKIPDKHEFYSNHINLSLTDLFESFEKYNVYVNGNTLLQLSLYDLAEAIMRSFNLIETSNAYLQFYLDVVLDFTQKNGSNISKFLHYFEKKKEVLSVISPKGQDAVQIITIHKSKGLEFPVVIFPYADLDMYRELDPKVWFKLDASNYNGFPHTLLNYNKDFEHFGEEGLYLHQTHQSELELDNLNLLYVVLTRAVEQLHIISKKETPVKGVINTKKYSGLLIAYLQNLGIWDNSQTNYTFGTPKKTTPHLKIEQKAEVQKQFISTPKEDHNIKVITNSGLLWDTFQEKAIEKGNLIHDVMAHVRTKNDVDMAIQYFLEKAIVNHNQAEALKKTVLQVINHPQLKPYYKKYKQIYNERDIISKNGVVLRPDRVVILENKNTIIIDYKTGAENKNHMQQLKLYQDALEIMGLLVTKKILVYINENIELKTC